MTFIFRLIEYGCSTVVWDTEYFFAAVSHKTTELLKPNMRVRRECTALEARKGT